MQPKQILLLLLLFITSLSAFPQNQNPYASIGKKVKVLTLTKGQYDETFDADSIQQIGSSLVNLRSMKVVKLLSDEESKQRLEGEKHSRFLSVDPLGKSYPYYTPYQFAGNKPINNIDLDGAEEYNYLRFKNRVGKTVLALLEVKDIFETITVAAPGGAEDNGMGGTYIPTVTIIVKNRSQKYNVWQVGQTFNSTDIMGAGVYWEYDEHVEYKSKAQAVDATDKDFENTVEDIEVLTSQAVYNVSQDIMQRDFEDGNLKRYQKLFKKSMELIEFQLHHLISQGLKNTNAFVKKAIEGGFKIDGKMNLTPIERFIAKYGVGRHAKHMKYTKQIDEFLNGLDISKYTPEQAKSLLQRLNDYILDKIIKNPDTKINDLNLDLGNFEH